MIDDPEILGTSGAIDDKGLLSITVPFFAATLDEALNVGQNPLPDKIEESGRTFRAGPSGHFEVEVTYEGESGDKNDNEKKNDAVYKATGGFREEPIEAHPKIKELIKK
jgi:hypothetical protein